MKKYLSLFLALVLFLPLCAVSFAEDSESVEGIEFLFDTADLEGNPVSSSDLFSQYEFTMVNVWATWCPPCVAELGMLQELYTAMQEIGCGMIGILVDNDLDAAHELIEANGITYPVIMIPDGLVDLIPLQYIPTSFFVGRDGSGRGSLIVGAYPAGYVEELSRLLEPGQYTEEIGAMMSIAE